MGIADLLAALRKRFQDAGRGPGSAVHPVGDGGRLVSKNASINNTKLTSGFSDVDELYRVCMPFQNSTVGSESNTSWKQAHLHAHNSTYLSIYLLQLVIPQQHSPKPCLSLQHKAALMGYTYKLTPHADSGPICLQALKGGGLQAFSPTILLCPVDPVLQASRS